MNAQSSFGFLLPDDFVLILSRLFKRDNNTVPSAASTWFLLSGGWNFIRLCVARQNRSVFHDWSAFHLIDFTWAARFYVVTPSPSIWIVLKVHKSKYNEATAIASMLFTYFECVRACVLTHSYTLKHLHHHTKSSSVVFVQGLYTNWRCDNKAWRKNLIFFGRNWQGKQWMNDSPAEQSHYTGKAS